MCMWCVRVCVCGYGTGMKSVFGRYRKRMRCVCVCMWCVRVCVCVCVSVCFHVSVRVCECMRVCICVHVCSYMHAYMCVFGLCVWMVGVSINPICVYLTPYLFSYKPICSKLIRYFIIHNQRRCDSITCKHSQFL